MTSCVGMYIEFICPDDIKIFATDGKDTFRLHLWFWINRMPRNVYDIKSYERKCLDRFLSDNVDTRLLPPSTSFTCSSAYLHQFKVGHLTHPNMHLSSITISFSLLTSRLILFSGVYSDSFLRQSQFFGVQ